MARIDGIFNIGHLHTVRVFCLVPQFVILHRLVNHPQAYNISSGDFDPAVSGHPKTKVQTLFDVIRHLVSKCDRRIYVSQLQLDLHMSPSRLENHISRRHGDHLAGVVVCPLIWAAYHIPATEAVTQYRKAVTIWYCYSSSNKLLNFLRNSTDRLAGLKGHCTLGTVDGYCRHIQRQTEGC